MASELYTAMIEAKAAFDADDMNVAKLDALEAAERAYNAELSKWGSAYDAIPSSDAKSSAIDNANDTETGDELEWLQIAVRTYEMNIDCGYYNCDGSAKD